MKADVNNNTASFDAENAESAQKSGNVCSISAILAYVITQNLMVVLHRLARVRLKNVLRIYKKFYCKNKQLNTRYHSSQRNRN
jgi:hypothetical protein